MNQSLVQCKIVFGADVITHSLTPLLTHLFTHSLHSLTHTHSNTHSPLTHSPSFTLTILFLPSLIFTHVIVSSPGKNWWNLFQAPSSGNANTTLSLSGNCCTADNKRGIAVSNLQKKQYCAIWLSCSKCC